MPPDATEEAARKLHENICEDDDRNRHFTSELSETDRGLRGLEAVLGITSPANFNLRTESDCSRFDDLLSADELATLEQRYNCGFRRDYVLDRLDLVASCMAGVVAGAVDFLLVGIPPQVGYLGELPHKVGPLSALLKRWNIDSNNILAKVAKVPYDRVGDREFGIRSSTPRDHRLLTPGHDPSPIGLIAAVFDIMRGGKTGISRDGLPFFEASTGTTIRNPFVAVALWLVHLLSDAATKMGLPPPAWTLTPLLQVGSLGEKQRTVADLARFMYLRGYDLRHFLASGASVAAGHLVTGAYFGVRRFLDNAYDAECARDERPGLPFRKHPRYLCIRMMSDVVACAANATKCAHLGSLGFNYPQWLALLHDSFSVASDALRCPTDILVDKALSNELELDKRLDALAAAISPVSADTEQKEIAFRGRVLRTFPGLSADGIRHPHDQKAFEALCRIPLLDKAIAKVLDHGFERRIRLLHLASDIRVTVNMFSRLHQLLETACQVLDVELPELYVATDPYPNAYTYGHSKPFMVVTSGLVDALEEEELLFVIGHELGHIKAEHVLYMTVAASIGSTVGKSGDKLLGTHDTIASGFHFPLLYWSRQAELTADRFGFLCIQEIRPCFLALMKLAGGAKSMFLDMSPDEFEKQVEDYEAPDEGTMKKLYKVLITAQDVVSFWTDPPRPQANYLERGDKSAFTS